MIHFSTTSMHYITEQRVVRGQHALHFDCDFFSEKYVEYCFVYVSQAISGAVADVRMDCLPTLPVRGKFMSFKYQTKKLLQGSSFIVD